MPVLKSCSIARLADLSGISAMSASDAIGKPVFPSIACRSLTVFMLSFWRGGLVLRIGENPYATLFFHSGIG